MTWGVGISLPWIIQVSAWLDDKKSAAFNLLNFLNFPKMFNYIDVPVTGYNIKHPKVVQKATFIGLDA